MELAYERERQWEGNFWWSVAGIALVNQMDPTIAAALKEFLNGDGECGESGGSSDDLS